MTTLRGKVSWFGGPLDTGVSPDEGLAFLYEVEDAPELFLPDQPPNTTGLARRLDPAKFYIATRWDYALTPKEMLPDIDVKVTNAKTGAYAYATPSDWGPHQDTDRVADISQGLMDVLGLTTDDEVIVEYEPIGATMAYNSICISSGHGLKVRGAHGIIDEVDEARRVTEQLADELRSRGVDVKTYHDDVSTSQSENLERITDWHNSQGAHDLDISVHFNAFEQSSAPKGCEVLYYSQSTLAAKLSEAIASNGFIDRGPKQRKDLYVLANTEAPSVLLEICFVDSEADCDVYADTFDGICSALADQLGGVMTDVEEEKPPPSYVIPRIEIEVDGEVIITVNGKQIT